MKIKEFIFQNKSYKIISRKLKISTVLEKYLGLLPGNFHENSDNLEMIKIMNVNGVFIYTFSMMTTMMSKMMKTMRDIPALDATAP